MRRTQILDYFERNPDLVIHARIDRDAMHAAVRMATTTGGEQVYRRYGVVRFDVDG